MSSEVAVRAAGLGKCYRIFGRPRDRLLHYITRGRRGAFQEFWALRDVSFEVRKGEAFGIIGRNGSGKSTLLQLVCGTLTPTIGCVETGGRVGALLELGAGFNPEFTGRENVYLNGAILGLSRRELDRRFPEIADFADIGAFMDAPVKTYSSGMFVRLAFAVQACVEPDLLVVDEALAVGDIFFRQKCYARIAELRRRGTAILLVSHAMNDVEQFCGQALVLERGEPRFLGGAVEAVKRYYLAAEPAASTPAPRSAPRSAPRQKPADLDQRIPWPRPDAFVDLTAVPQVGSGAVRCTGLAVCDSQGEPRLVFRQGETAWLHFEFETAQSVDVPFGGAVIQNDKGVIVHGRHLLQGGPVPPRGVPAGSRIRVRQSLQLDVAAGEYTLEIGLGELGADDYERRAQYQNSELDPKIRRLCVLPGAARLLVAAPSGGGFADLPFYGVANLSGSCEIAVLEPEAAHAQA
jgi:lipopolysaccharide transport system ATP-binding protein